jgi:hypothetical protein
MLLDESSDGFDNYKYPNGIWTITVYGSRLTTCRLRSAVKPFSFLKYLETRTLSVQNVMSKVKKANGYRMGIPEEYVIVVNRSPRT